MSGPISQYPFPYSTEDAEASIEDVDSTKIKVSFVIDKGALRDVLERWTWNRAKVTIEALDRDVVIHFPAIKENVQRRF